MKKTVRDNKEHQWHRIYRRLLKTRSQLNSLYYWM